VRKVTDGKGEWEVERCKHDGDENPPASQARDEGKCPSRLETSFSRCSPRRKRGRTHEYQLRSLCSSNCVGRVLIYQGQVEVRACETRERADQSEEDGEEDDVGAKRADQEDEAD
jgi:hypothetical protein